MGLSCCLFYKPSSSFHGIRVVHLNGYVEDFTNPISVDELTGTPPKHFVCTSEQLVSFKSSKTLPPDTQLQMGQLYFLLPFSVLESENSPVDRIFLSNRLTAAAKLGGSDTPSRSPKQVKLGRSKSTKERVNPFSPSMERSSSTPERVSSTTTMTQQNKSPLDLYGDDDKMCHRSKSWKPILETIIEKSFGRLSERSFSHRSESFGHKL